MTNRQIQRTVGNYILSSKFDGGNAFDFKAGNHQNSIDVFPASDAQGF